MKKNETTICEHCKGTGRCSCDDCWNADMFKPDYSQIPSLKWSKDTVSCIVCGGSGRLEIFESSRIPKDKE